MPYTDNDDHGYFLVMSRRAKRRLRNGSQASRSSSSTTITTIAPPLTVVFTPVTASHNLMKADKRSLSVCLEHLVPGQLQETDLILLLWKFTGGSAVSTFKKVAFPLHVGAFCTFSGK